MCCWYKGYVPSKTPSQNYGRLIYRSSCKNKKCIHPYHIWVDRRRDRTTPPAISHAPPPPPSDPQLFRSKNYPKEDGDYYYDDDDDDDDDAIDSERGYESADSTSLSSPCGSPGDEFKPPNS